MSGKRFGLIAARKAAGLSQERLAELMGVDRSTVQRWESGQSAPQPGLRPKLARVLRISDAKLAELLGDQPCTDGQPQTSPDAVMVRRCAGQQSGGSDLLPFPLGGDRTDRRQAVTLLGTSTLGVGAVHAGLDPFTQSAGEAMEFTRRAEASQLGSRTLEHLDSVVADLAAAFGHTPPGELFAKARWYRHQVEDLITGQHTLREGRELYRHAGSLSIILAGLLQDLDDPVTAEAHCLDAWEHGWQAEDHEICALAMDAKARIFIYNNQPSVAKDAAERGLKQVPHSGAAAVRVSAQLARAYAKLGQADQFQDALKDAQNKLNQLDHQNLRLFGADSGRLASYAASSYIWLGQPKRAASYAQEAIAFYRDGGLPGRVPTREAIARLDLALAYANLGQLDDAAEHIEQALNSERITETVLSRLGDLTVCMQHRYPQLEMTKELVDRRRGLTASLRHTEALST